MGTIELDSMNFYTEKPTFEINGFEIFVTTHKNPWSGKWKPYVSVREKGDTGYPEPVLLYDPIDRNFGFDSEDKAREYGKTSAGSILIK